MCLRLAGVVYIVIASAVILLAARELCRASAAAPSLEKPGPTATRLGPQDQRDQTPCLNACQPEIVAARQPPRRLPPSVDVEIETEPAVAAATPDNAEVTPRLERTDEAPATVPAPPSFAQPGPESGGDFIPLRAAPVAHLEASEPDDRPLVRFAAGAVELRAPDQWSVVEAPVDREVRMVLTPQRSVDSLKSLRDGMWLAFHPRPEHPAAIDLNDVLPDRLQRATDAHAWPGHSESLTVDGHPALRRWFVLEGEQAGKPAFRGYHLFVDTEWGLCEVHAVSPEASFDQRAEQFDRILDSLRLSSPQPKRQKVAPQVRDAQAILGCWKALGSRLRIYGDGRITILFDKPQRADGGGDDAAASRPQVLTGRFEADGDLLRVTWSDGSLLNFRWRRLGNNLLLTDHRGQVSQLQLLLE